MNHERARALLPAAADGQLSFIRRWVLDRHIARCPSCLAETEALLALRTSLRTHLTVYRTPPALAARIASALPREAPPVTARPFRLHYAGTALAGCLAGVALTLAVTRWPAPPDPLLGDVVADHVRSLMADHLTDVATSDQHTVKPWLSARLDLSPVVRDFAAEGYPLVGGRLDYVDGHRAAAIVYRRDKHVINVFAFVANGPDDVGPDLRTRDGFNVITWQSGGLRYAAVSDVEAGQLMALVRLIEGG
jgi:anti-sigma factor RsiW